MKEAPVSSRLRTDAPSEEKTETAEVQFSPALSFVEQMGLFALLILAAALAYVTGKRP